MSSDKLPVLDHFRFRHAPFFGRHLEQRIYNEDDNNLFIYLNSSQLNAALHIIQWVNSAGATTVRYQGKALTDT